MSLIPQTPELLARARADLRMGLPVVLTGEGDAAALVAAAETLDAARLAALRAADPDLVLAITARRSETLKARAYDGDLARLRLPRDAGLTWIAAVADPADDLAHPMKGPMTSCRDGDAGLHRVGIALAKSARLLPAVVVARADDAALAQAGGLTRIAAAAAVPHLADRSVLAPVVHACLPMEAAEAGRLHIYRPEDGGEEHYAIEIGRPDRDAPVLARLHSACFTGDVLGSLKCDCGPQLRAALVQMGTEGAGVLLYLNQEGRGIGLAAKMHAYKLQEAGLDTIEANEKLGFSADLRDYGMGAQILQDIGLGKIRLMTNNPKKVVGLEGYGLEIVEQLPISRPSNPHNERYLETKRSRMGHSI